ncbi:MAG: biosynthetic arginine decarboxylase [Pirellulaceae bacterium]
MLNTFENDWSLIDACELYNLERWGLGYFDVDEEGFLVANPSDDKSKSIRIFDIVEHYLKQEGAAPPVLVRFPGIIHRRMNEINNAFRTAISNFDYNNTYSTLYPVKVNQHFEVIDAAIRAGKEFGGGVEAGSKAELYSVIAMADNTTPILCNGFKDLAVVEMALRASQLGRDVTIVIEKPNEIDLVVQTAKRLGIRPKLGVRVKLSARGAGHWQSSGGSRSKFGLSIPELVKCVADLKEAGFIDCVHLLHFHPGSQITNVRKIKASIIEATRVYADLVQQGVPLKIIDVGGGLAVDYTGNRNKEPSSMNYTLQEYANDVVYYIQMVCDQEEVAHPRIYSESGRALVAHHSMLIVPVVGTSQTHVQQSLVPTSDQVDEEVAPLVELSGILEDINVKNLLECYHDMQTSMEIALQMFSNGNLTMEQRAQAESLTNAICLKINDLLDDLPFVPAELDELRYNLADTYFANFSVFQALPDAWALDQLFPVMPIHRINERPTKIGILGDMTCDSDGKIDCFIGGTGQRRWLPMHALNDQPYWIGLFLVGAYQESLSDDHNLMGKFHILTVDECDPYNKSRLIYGSTVREVLEHVHHQFADMTKRFRETVDTAISESRVSETDGKAAFRFFESMGENYTYLTDEIREIEAIHHGQRRD